MSKEDPGRREASAGPRDGESEAGFGRPICVSVCDPQGFLVAFARMEGSPVRSIQISQGKAYSAARMGASTRAILERLKREDIEIGYFCDPLLAALVFNLLDPAGSGARRARQ